MLNAARGFKSMLATEPNFRIHFAATILVVVAGFLRHLDAMRWVALVIVIGLVWITEAINTAIELLCDLYCNKQYHPIVKVIKDVAAAAVLTAAVVSVVTGIIMFFF